jgi:hypothetical protein
MKAELHFLMLKPNSSQSSGCTRIHKTSQKKLKQTLSACQKAYGNCFLRQERSGDSGIHATGDHNVRSILKNTKETA